MQMNDNATLVIMIYFQCFVLSGSLCMLSHGTRLEVNDCVTLLPTGTFTNQCLSFSSSDIYKVVLQECKNHKSFHVNA